MGDKKTISKVKSVRLGGELLDWWEQQQEEGNVSHHVRQALKLYIEFQKKQREKYLSFLFKENSKEKKSGTESKNDNTNVNKKRVERKKTDNISTDDVDENIKFEKEKTEEEIDLEELNKNLDNF